MMRLWIEPNLTGDREIEYGFIERWMPVTGGLALDIGAGGVTRLADAARANGYRVLSVDKTNADIRGDIRRVELPRVNLILCCSTVEHIGLAGRYGEAADDPDGDLTTMRRMARILEPGGCMLLTAPVGIDRVHGSMHRVYGAERLPRLLEGFTVTADQYWVRVAHGWMEVDRDTALSQYSVTVNPEDWQGSVYGLAGFVLEKR